ncbi:MAG: extracellular solute-binding protein [Planctomycetota bacterium]
MSILESLPPSTAPEYKETFVERLPLQLSLGAWLIIIIAVVSSVVVLAWPEKDVEGLTMWTFARNHSDMYIPLAEEYNAANTDKDDLKLNIFLIDGQALQRRMLSGFMSDTPVADLIEVEQGVIGKVFSGPLEDVGFVDLTDRLKSEGIYEQINEPSFSQWSTRGRIFGIPHDVHPVVLLYRHDILVEELGYDVEAIETWDEFADTLRAAQDIDGDGKADRYLLNLWYTNADMHEMLLMQAGGGFFDENDKLAIDTELNAFLMAKLITWMIGPDRIAVDAADFSAPGNELRLTGRVLAGVAPDWLTGVYQGDLPQLSGKWRAMPMPAWTPGGRRTSVWGGTCLGITKQTEDFEAAWEAAKLLYLTNETARKLWEQSLIISPVIALWDEPFYHEPVEYFGGQRLGSLFIELAPDVPTRSSSPFRNLARSEWANAMSRLYRYADQNEAYTVEALQPRARELLGEVQAEVEKQMGRNVFVRDQLTQEQEAAQ